MANRKRIWVADIFQGLSACFLGRIALYILHALLFRQWINIFEYDTPEYFKVQTIFMSLPFIIGPMIIGLVAGSGKVRPWWRISIRLLFGPIISLLLLTKESAEFTKGFIPMLCASFAIAVINDLRMVITRGEESFPRMIY